jgi:hypothetical protein
MIQKGSIYDLKMTQNKAQNSIGIKKNQDSIKWTRKIDFKALFRLIFGL